MAKKHKGGCQPLSVRENTILETAMLQTAANTLIIASCGADAVTQALHPVRWLYRNVHPRTRRMLHPALLEKESPRLLQATRQLVAIAKKYLAGISRPKHWAYGHLVEEHGPKYADREIARRDEVYGEILCDAKKYLAQRRKQRAPHHELLALRIFISQLAHMCDQYRPNHGPTLPQPGNFRSVEIPVSRDYPHTSGRN